MAVTPGAPIAFALIALALAVAAKCVGDVTEDVAVHLGPRRGGLINAVLCNATEIVVALFALHAGLSALAKSSLIGAILVNLLLALGVAALLGGLRHGAQYFDRTQAGLSGTMMVLSVVALMLPALYDRVAAAGDARATVTLSEAVAAVIVVVYLLSLYYSLVWDPAEQAIAGVHRSTARRPLRAAALALAASLTAVVVLAWLLVRATPAMIAATGASEFFVGAVLVPLVGCGAQRIVAVELAWHNRMDVATTIVLGSSLQLVLFVAPVLLFGSVLVRHPMDLVFTDVEIAALAAAVLVAALVGLDGESHWLEGVLLIAVYLLLALLCYWWPAAADAPAGMSATGIRAAASLVLPACLFG